VTSSAMRTLVRERVLALRSVAHGSVAATELTQFGFSPRDVLDFSVNTNPLGPAPNVIQAIQGADWTRYPGDDEAPLRRALARHAGVAPDQVALGNGSAELMWLIALALLVPADRVAIVGPTFGEYARAAFVVGADVVEVQSLADVPAAARLVFVCNPNNPTGAYRARAEIEQFLTDGPDRLVVLDEAYASFVEDRWPSEPLLDQFPNLIILRSLTKDHALPGLRLGYAFASIELARAFETVRPPWSVNAGALRAGLATLKPQALSHVRRATAVVSESRHLLITGFSALGYSVHPSVANFMLVDVGDGSAFRRSLLPHGIVVRDCTSFGLPSCVRIACRLPEQCTRLLEVVESLKLQ
jgi:histidinol-phosphate aminotransferase